MSETCSQSVDATGPVAVIDDDSGLRDALAELFDSAGLECQGYDSAEAYFDALERGEARAQGCAVVDVCLPGKDGMSVLRRLVRMAPGFPVIMITGHGDVPMAVEALKTGAVDFIEKPFDPDSVLNAVRQALGRSAEDQRHHALIEQVLTRLDLLTPREREVVDHMVVGQSNKEIAAQLGISPRTIEIHRARVMEKMQVGTLAELVRLMVPIESTRS
jgi:two-component system response regulator FixJ